MLKRTAILLQIILLAAFIYPQVGATSPKGTDIVIVLDCSMLMAFESENTTHTAAPWLFSACENKEHFYLQPAILNPYDLAGGITYPRAVAEKANPGISRLANTNLFVFYDEKRMETVLLNKKKLWLSGSFLYNNPGFEAWKYHFKIEDGILIHIKDNECCTSRYNEAKQQAKTLIASALTNKNNRVCFVASGEAGSTRHSVSFTNDYEKLMEIVDSAPVFWGGDIASGLEYAMERLNRRTETEKLNRKAYVFVLSGLETFPRSNKARADFFESVITSPLNKTVFTRIELLKTHYIGCGASVIWLNQLAPK